MRERRDSQPVAVVCDLHVTGMSMVRNLAMHGIPVIGIDCNPRRIGFFTRYGRKIVCPDPVSEQAGLRDFLCRIGEKMLNGGVLFPASDNFVLFISNHRDELSHFFRFALPARGVVEKLVSKRGLLEIAYQAGFPTPRTFLPKDRDEAVDFSRRMEYPCIIKPEYAQSWHEERTWPYTMGRKVIKVRSARELLETYERLSKIDKRIVFQEIIPGDDDHLFQFISYLDKNSEPLASFTSRRLRVMPIHFGTTTCAESLHHPDLEERCIHLLSTCRYHGLSEVDVKEDPRDGEYKLIEINARFGLSDVLATKCGVDLPFIAYQDLTGKRVRKVPTYRTGIKWIFLESDLRAFLYYRREGTLTLRKWLRSLKGEKEWEVFSFRDPVPGIRMFLRFVNVILRHLRAGKFLRNVDRGTRV